MNAVEEIEAAIAKLTTLRDSAFAGTWEPITTGRIGGDHWYIVSNDEAIMSVSANDGSDEDLREPTANLVTTLHATIDAQLAILRGGVEFTRKHPQFHDSDILALARAILGVTS